MKYSEKWLDLEYIFHPRSVAVAGASTDPMKQGYVYLELLLDYEFAGPIYPIHARESEILGLKCYPSIKDIAGPVDYVISCLPARLVPQLMEDCVAKGVKVVHLYTGRLSERGDEEGIRLEQEIVQIARQGNIRIIGPNCMGLYYPRERLSFKFNLPKDGGKVGFFSQSGGNAVDLAYRASIRGIRFSKVVSYGNACDLNEADFLEYFLGDPETEIITGYIEGVKEGPRFLRALREATKVKPVIILKGGRTETGTQAVASHTASLAGSNTIWDALLQQNKAIRVYSLEELADVALAFLFLRPPKSRRVAVMGGGGGQSVQSADDCDSAGLVLPLLPPEIREQIKSVAPETWIMVKNPVDGSVIGDPSAMPETMRLVAGYEEIDLIIGVAGEYWTLERPRGVALFHQTIENFLELGRTFDKPMAVVIGSGDAPQDWRWKAVMEEQERLFKAGFPVYPTIGRAAQAISKFIQYHEDRSQ